MARFRLSRLARADLAQILTVSFQRWGTEGRRRYSELLAAAMRKVAAEPDGSTTRDRVELYPGVRSLLLRNAVSGGAAAGVRRPVHLLYYRVVRSGLVEIVRILHERMESGRHTGAPAEE
jgi:toxin ParE1/3/4